MRILSAHTSPLFLLAVATLTAAACSDPIDPTNLADQAALHVREIVHQTGGGVAFTQSEDSGLRRMAHGVTNAGNGLAGAMPSPMPPGMMSAMSGSPMAMAAVGLPSMMTTEEQFDDTADQLKMWLRERILADANLESKTDEEAIFLLHPDPTCRALPRDGDPAGTIPPIDNHCVDQLTRLQVRISLRADGNGIRLTVLVGPDRLELSAFIIHSDLIAIETDLAKAYQATQYIDQTLGTDSPTDMTRLETLAGRLRLSVQKLGEKKATIALSVLDAIHVAVRDAAGAPGPEIKLAATTPAVAVTLDGVAQSVTVQENIGALDVWGDWSSPVAVSPNRDLHVGIGGFTGQGTFTESDDHIALTGLGVGNSVVEVRGAPIFNLGLNPADMHRFDVLVTVDAADQPHFEIQPRFDLSLGFHLGAIAGELTNEPPSYLLDETYQIVLENGGAPASLTSAPATADFSGGIKVTAGSLSLSSDKAAAPVVVPAGQCLTGGATAAPDAHPLLGQFSVVACPL